MNVLVDIIIDVLVVRTAEVTNNGRAEEELVFGTVDGKLDGASATEETVNTGTMEGFVDRLEAVVDDCSADPSTKLSRASCKSEICSFVASIKSTRFSGRSESPSWMS